MGGSGKIVVLTGRRIYNVVLDDLSLEFDPIRISLGRNLGTGLGGMGMFQFGK